MASCIHAWVQSLLTLGGAAGSSSGFNDLWQVSCLEVSWNKLKDMNKTSSQISAKCKKSNIQNLKTNYITKKILLPFISVQI